MSTPEPRLLRAHEAADMLGISERKLWELMNRGELRHVRIGRSVRYRLDDLHQWIEDHTKDRPHA